MDAMAVIACLRLSGLLSTAPLLSKSHAVLSGCAHSAAIVKRKAIRNLVPMLPLTSRQIIADALLYTEIERYAEIHIYPCRSDSRICLQPLFAGATTGSKVAGALCHAVRRQRPESC